MKNKRFPFFSIIIPCYNVVSFIDKALRALELQTFSDFEVILVDDCSTDNTYEHCAQRIDNSSLDIVLLKNDVNSGPGASRNRGIQCAKGRFIGFCDSDDWYEPNLLELVYEKVRMEQSDIVLFDYYRCFSNEKKMKANILSHYDNCKDKEDFVALATDSLWSLIVKRNLLSKVPIANLYNAEDVVTVPLLVAEAECVSYLNLPLYNYLYRPQSLSTNANERLVNNFLEAYNFLITYKKGYDAAFEFLCIKLVVYGVFYNAIRCGMKKKFFWKILDEFEQNYPDWYKSRYLKYLPMRKRVWMFCVKHNSLFMLKFYCCLQSSLFRLLK